MAFSLFERRNLKLAAIFCSATVTVVAFQNCGKGFDLNNIGSSDLSSQGPISTKSISSNLKAGKVSSSLSSASGSMLSSLQAKTSSADEAKIKSDCEAQQTASTDSCFTYVEPNANLSCSNITIGNLVNYVGGKSTGQCLKFNAGTAGLCKEVSNGQITEKAFGCFKSDNASAPKWYNLSINTQNQNSFAFVEFSSNGVDHFDGAFASVGNVTAATGSLYGNFDSLLRYCGGSDESLAAKSYSGSRITLFSKLDESRYTPSLIINCSGKLNSEITNNKSKIGWFSGANGLRFYSNGKNQYCRDGFDPKAIRYRQSLNVLEYSNADVEFYTKEAGLCPTSILKNMGSSIDVQLQGAVQINEVINSAHQSNQCYYSCQIKNYQDLSASNLESGIAVQNLPDGTSMNTSSKCKISIVPEATGPGTASQAYASFTSAKPVCPDMEKLINTVTCKGVTANLPSTDKKSTCQFEVKSQTIKFYVSADNVPFQKYFDENGAPIIDLGKTIIGKPTGSGVAKCLNDGTWEYSYKCDTVAPSSSDPNLAKEIPKPSCEGGGGVVKATDGSLCHFSWGPSVVGDGEISATLDKNDGSGALKGQCILPNATDSNRTPKAQWIITESRCDSAKTSSAPPTKASCDGILYEGACYGLGSVRCVAGTQYRVDKDGSGSYVATPAGCCIGSSGGLGYFYEPDQTCYKNGATKCVNQVLYKIEANNPIVAGSCK